MIKLIRPTYNITQFMVEDVLVLLNWNYYIKKFNTDILVRDLEGWSMICDAVAL